MIGRADGQLVLVPRRRAHPSGLNAETPDIFTDYFQQEGGKTTKNVVWGGKKTNKGNQNKSMILSFRQAARAEKQALVRKLDSSSRLATAMKAEAEIHAVQLEALLALKQALTTEVGRDSATYIQVTPRYILINYSC